MRIIVAVSFALILALAAPARADTITVGLFAPSAPFASTASRVELATRLADHLGKALGSTGTGKVYARAGDFAAAVKRGDLAVALVDPAYLARTTGYTVIAASLAHGDTDQAWQLIARTGTKLADLRGKRVLVPANGGHESELVFNVLLGGERGLFAVEAAPDTASAVAALGLGKADAAVVPTGVDLPAGATKLLALPELPTPVLVAFGTVSGPRRAALAAAAASFKGDATVGGFRDSTGDGVRTIAKRSAAPVKRAPFLVPAVRLLVGDLVEARTFSIERTPPTAFVVTPR